MKTGIVTFAGAGPGAVDLLTLRCRDAIAEADTIVYAGSLVNPDVLRFASPKATLFDSSGMTLEQTSQILVEAAQRRQKVLRLHTGDPSVYGAIAEQAAELKKQQVDFEIIPGVSSVFAAAAAAGCELTLPGVSQTVILTRRAGRTPVPKGESLPELAAHGATLALFLSVGDMPGLVEELLHGGYHQETPVVVVYRASWPDQKVLRGTLATISAQVADAEISRQAIVLIGAALSGRGEASKLYDAGFSHGYRCTASAKQSSAAAVDTAAAPESDSVQADASTTSCQNMRLPTKFCGNIAVFALTENGCRLACRLKKVLPVDLFLSEKHAAAADTASVAATTFEPTRLADLLAAHWDAYDAHILIMAAGIAVRKIAPLLHDKATDPAVVVCDENGDFAISLVGGHIAGGNRLAGQVAALLGAEPVITTATDAQGLPAFDEVAALLGWQILNPRVVKKINAALLSRRPIGFFGPQEVLNKYFAGCTSVKHIEAITPCTDFDAVVAVDAPEDVDFGTAPTLRLRPLPLTIGIGCRRGVSAAEIAAATDQVLLDHALDPARVEKVASVTAKQDEAGLLAFAESKGWTVEFFDSETLAGISVPTPSAAAARAVGTASVSEAAALAASEGRLLIPKCISGNVTVAVAANTPHPVHAAPESGSIIAVGIAAGTRKSLTGEAVDALRQADVIVGYRTYCQQLQPFFPEKCFLSSGMRQEVDRCRAAIAEAATGRTVAVISSGDAGVYGMAGLLLELLAEEYNANADIDLQVVPGVTAALAAAAVLGAPLMNDFAAISLSDLLSDRDMIINRLELTAAAGIPCALYNPRSRKRTELLDAALQIFGRIYGPNHPCGLVNDAGREHETHWIGTLAELPVQAVNMSTLIIVGGRDTCILKGRLITRRGYAKRMD